MSAGQEAGNAMADIGRSTPADQQVVWARARERMRRDLGESLFNTWIGPLTLETWSVDEIRIGAPKPFVRDWVSSRYIPKIERALGAEGIAPRSIAIVVVAPTATIGGNVVR